MDNNEIQLYTPFNYAATGESVTMSVFVSTESGHVPIDSLVSEFTANFNDYTAVSYICTFDNYQFEYAYATDFNLATISISATLNGNLSSNEFEVLRVDPTIKQTDFDVVRVSPISVVKLPNSLVYIPTNEWAVSETYNKIVDQLYDNMDYLIDLCSIYSSSPTRYLGWADFVDIPKNAYYEVSANPEASDVYGVIGDTHNVVKLQAISEEVYAPGTSLIHVISTFDVGEISTVSLSSGYCSNLVNRGIQMLSATDRDLTTISETVTSTPFTHTVIDYPLVDQNGRTVVPELSGYLVIESGDDNRVVPYYTLSATILPINFQYTPKTIDWHLRNQFNYVSVVSGNESFGTINDIVISNDTDLYVTRGSFIEKYDITTANVEMIYTTQSIDISEIYTNAKSVGISTDERVYMLDNNRHLVHIYQTDLITGKVDSVGRWGALGGATAKQGFYKPNQMFVHNDNVYICDTGNNVIKRYSLQGNWNATFNDIIAEDSTDTIISACVDIDGAIHVLTESGIVKISNDGLIIQTTLFEFASDPVKIVANYDGGLLYVCCKDRVYRMTIGHEETNSFALLDMYTFPYVNTYKSIAVDNHGSIYLTDGHNIIKYLDIPDVLHIRKPITDSQFWSRDDIYIEPTELVDEWVYNRSIRRMAENLDILYKSLENKLLPVNDTDFRLAPYDESDTGLLQGLPVTLDDFCTIGINEFVTCEVLNRCFDNLQQNIFYILCLIMNCFTHNKAGLEVNFVVMPPVLPNCCWSWWARSEGRCCTPWYWLTDSTTWVHAESHNNAAWLQGGWFAIPDDNTSVLSNISPDLSLSFRLSTSYFSPDPNSYYNIVGFTNITDRGIALGVSGSEFVANINGSYFTTTGSVMENSANSNGVHVVFNKFTYQSIPGCEFYIDNVPNKAYYVDVPGTISPAPLFGVESEYSLNEFVFGASGVDIIDSFTGILRDIWIFEGELQPSQIYALSGSPHYWELPNSWRRNAKAHWYGNSSNWWADDIGNNNATMSGGTTTTLNNLYGSCCDV